MRKISIYGLVLLAGCSHGGLEQDRAPSSATSVKFVAGNDYSSSVQALLESATTSIEIVQFNFGESTGLAQELLKIKEQHSGDPQFRIRVLVEKSGFGADKANAAALAALDQGGFAGNPGSQQPYSYYQLTGKSDASGNTGITHTKLVLVDGHMILAGSTNWTTTSISRNNETDLLIDSEKLGRSLRTYIGAIQSDPTALYEQTASDANITLFMDSTYLDGIQQFFSSVGSGDRLDCSMYFFNYDDPIAPQDDKPANVIASALGKIARAGSPVKLMLESSSLSFSKDIVAGNRRGVSALAKTGAEIWWDNPSVISHMKFCVRTRADGGYNVVLGSSNWNYLDIELNHQINWIIDDPSGSVAKPLLGYFSHALSQPGVKRAN